MQIKVASRLRSLPPYLFAELDRLKKEVQQHGVDVISLGIGDPDLPTPAAYRRGAEAHRRDYCEPSLSRLSGSRPFPRGGHRMVSAAVQRQARSGREACALIGSKEGIANFPVAVVDPGDIVLMPDPGYPVYYSGCVFNGGEPFYMPLRKENAFLPDFQRDSGRSRAPRQADVAQLSQQSDRRDR